MVDAAVGCVRSLLYGVRTRRSLTTPPRILNVKGGNIMCLCCSLVEGMRGRYFHDVGVGSSVEASVVPYRLRRQCPRELYHCGRSLLGWCFHSVKLVKSHYDLVPVGSYFLRSVLSTRAKLIRRKIKVLP